VMAQNELGDDAVVATVFCDDNKKYLSTDLMRREPVRGEYLSPEIELLHYEAVRRECRLCADEEDTGDRHSPPPLS
jgi:cysteine synthase